MPDAALPSRFLEEVPQHLLEDLSGGRERATTWGGYAASYGSGSSSRSGGRFNEDGERHYSYEDEDQSTPAAGDRNNQSYGNAAGKPRRDAGSIDNIASFFSSRGGATAKRPKLSVPEATGVVGFKSGQRVRHPKYGDGVVFRREGDGDDAKITVQFTKFGVKKLVEKFAQLERV
jgi:DNA helicase-2/ATP-dependent DNA helicase PcrA